MCLFSFNSQFVWVKAVEGENSDKGEDMVLLNAITAEYNGQPKGFLPKK